MKNSYESTPDHRGADSVRNDGISVVVCCYNSEQRLPETLLHLWQQVTSDGTPIEVVLVDNNCTDRTIDIAKHSHAVANTSIPLRIITEKKPGLTSARITGIRHALYETIILCDDDNWLESDYCLIAHKIMSEHPTVGLAGGCSTGVFEIEPPPWFDSISGAWALGTSYYQGYLEGDDAFLRGAGLIVRRSYFLELLESGFEFIASDRKGKNLSSGGDSEFSREFTRLGYRLYFDSRLQLKHWITSNRLTREYAMRLWEGFGAGTIPGDADRIAKLGSQRIRNYIRTSWMYQVARGSIRLLCTITKSPIFHKHDPRPALGWCSQKGRILAIVGMRSKYRRLILKRVDWLEKTCSATVGVRLDEMNET
jgi:glycosyltransferase involved in cell wall biosynthesis